MPKSQRQTQSICQVTLLQPRVPSGCLEVAQASLVRVRVNRAAGRRRWAGRVPAWAATVRRCCGLGTPRHSPSPLPCPPSPAPSRAAQAARAAKGQAAS